MMKLLKIPFMVALAAVAVMSCKKDEETEVKYMDGSIKLEFPTYVQPGFTKTFNLDTLMTVTRDDGGKVGYYFTTPVSGIKDTLVTEDGVVLIQEYECVITDTLGNFTLSLTAFGGDYVNTTGSKSFTIVKPGVDGKGSITGFELDDDDKPFTDERDGQAYYTSVVGNTEWMRQNLAWKGAGRPYQDCDAMTEIFGRYYTWEEAQSACPPGWQLPSDADWAALAAEYGDTSTPGYDYEGLAGDLLENLYFNGTRMWEYWREVNVTNAAGLSIMPAGYALVEDGKYNFDDVYEYAAFWTSDSEGDDGVFRYIVAGYDTVYWGTMPKTDMAYSVRCVRHL